MRSVVVLPQPDGPRNDTNSPRSAREHEVLDRGEGAERLLDVGQLQEAHACLAHQWAPPISIRVRVSRPMNAMAIIASQVSPKLMSATAAGS